LKLSEEVEVESPGSGKLLRSVQAPKRSRIVSAVLLALVAVLGLGSRRFAASLPYVIAAYAGDTAWALAVYIALGLLFPHLSTVRCAILTLIIAYLVEFSQLYHAPWIDAVRAYSLGHLALGSGFDPSDLVCYTAGVGIGVLIDRFRNHT
jgi:hypothetical protein